MSRTNGKQYWEARCIELEELVEECAVAFELIPVGALEAGKQWFPSDVALLRLNKAKAGVLDYLRRHRPGGNGI